MGDTQSQIAQRLNEIRDSKTLEVAQTVASLMQRIMGGKFLPHHIEVDSFELSYNGEDFEGGSWYINKDREIVLASVTPQQNFGKVGEWKQIKSKMKAFFK
jgi:hypothetical protein